MFKLVEKATQCHIVSDCTDIYISPITLVHAGNTYYIVTHYFICNAEIFQLYHGENKLNFNEMMLKSLCTRPKHLVGYLQCQQPETTVRGQTCRPTRIHYPDSKPNSLRFLSLMLSGEATNTKSIVFDPIGARIHDLSHSRRAR